ncbi:Rv3235 family protein [[Mycobacterium] kokjensenii]|uniref:Rv3235 family protein n=1 Tax=[Mycobacterium] kokjensenii TaxID=3064287 RepID=A0ABM9LN14_9MYCO|nr:Rv3235 family protein [Mycolicibacter sp. MU0083]CAJ1501733.1 Rv3235 family protein [Mycolicibacter sp. MU0083]
MSTVPAPPRSPAVAPVIDYEPPARATVARRTAHAPASSRSARPRRGHPPGVRPGPPPRDATPASVHAAARFCDAALRRVLEVVDQRRPAAHLYPLLAAGLADSVLAARPAAPPGRVEPAILQRVRVQSVDSAETTRAMEVFGTYRRGRRTHALACRIESVTGTGNGLAWQIVALHIG